MFSKYLQLVCTSVVLFCNYHSLAQSPIWGTPIQTQGSSDILFLTMAPNNDIYAAGFGDKAAMIDESFERSDAFISRMDSSGEVKWAHQIGGTIASGTAGIASNKQGDLFVIGGFLGEIYLKNNILKSQGIDTLTYYLIKFDQHGEKQWGKTFLQTIINDVATDEEGNVYLVAEAFPAGPISAMEYHLCKFSPDGQLLDEQLVGSISPALGAMTVSSVVVDKYGNINVLGEILDAININGVLYSFFGERHPVLIKYDEQMEVTWVKVLDGGYPNLRSQQQLLCDGLGNIFLVALQLDGAIATKFDTNGDKLWSLIPDYNGDFNNGCHLFTETSMLDEMGNLLMAGTLYNGDVKINGTNVALQSTQRMSGVVIKCAPTGDVIWSLTGAESSYDKMYTMTRDSQNGNIYVGGNFYTTRTQYEKVTIENSVLTTTGFILKIRDKHFQPLTNPLGKDTVLCAGEPFMIRTKKFIEYSWSDGSQDSTLIVSTPGDYYLTAIDYLGKTYRDTIRIDKCFESTLPNVITPNGDPMNEYLVFEQLDTSKGNIVTIYDRWGKQIFQEVQYQNNWNGRDVSNGIYYYVVFNATTRRKYKGWLQVVK